jgi:hypothetical protein
MEQLEFMIELAIRHRAQEDNQAELDRLEADTAADYAYWESVYAAPVEITAYYLNEDGKKVRRKATVQGFEDADAVVAETQSILDVQRLSVHAVLEEEKISLLTELKIKVTNPGLLEVPEGKEVTAMPLAHFVKLAKKKGFAPISRGLINLVVFNKNKDKKLSAWAGKMQKALAADTAKKRKNDPEYGK